MRIVKNPRGSKFVLPVIEAVRFRITPDRSAVTAECPVMLPASGRVVWNSAAIIDVWACAAARNAKEPRIGAVTAVCPWMSARRAKVRRTVADIVARPNPWMNQNRPTSPITPRFA